MKKVSKQTIIFIAIALIAIVILIGVINRTNVHNQMIGKTVSGNYDFNPTSSAHSCRDYYEVHFIDEKYCNVYVRYKWYSYGQLSESREVTYKNIPYTVTGLFSIKINFDNRDIQSAENFKASIRNGRIYLHTQNYNSHTSMWLIEE